METETTYLTKADYLFDYNAIVKTIQHYIDGSREGNSDLMEDAFHTDATLVGYVGSNMLFTPIQVLFNWIDENGPAPEIMPNFASIEILETVAVVRLEVMGWSGKNAGSGVHMSDLFNLVKTDEGWKISQKLFHWHSQTV